MAKVISEKKVEIYECRTDDGGVGIKIGDGPIHMGIDEVDLFRLLQAAIPEVDPHNPDVVDGDLVQLADVYLDYWTAQERYRYLRDMNADWEW